VALENGRDRVALARVFPENLADIRWGLASDEPAARSDYGSARDVLVGTPTIP
jgi:hypothetical protein